ncbi:MAG: hypothetical protein ACI8RZ_004740 [Myxococcota bacterium]|jgi:hypothetical protein
MEEVLKLLCVAHPSILARGILCSMKLSAGRILPRLGLLAVGLLIGLAVAEIGVRASGRDPLNGILHDPRAERGASTCFQLDDDAGYVYIPGQCGTNNLGFPDRETPVERPPDHDRILVLGDSISGDRAFAHFLEEILSDGPGRNTQVVNTGVPGYSTLNEVGLYEKWGPTLDADTVVLQFCLNDYAGTPLLFENEGRVIKVLHHRSEQWGRSSRLFSLSGLYRFITYQAQTQGAPMETMFEPTEAALSQLQDRLAAEGRDFLVVVFPSIAQQWEPWASKAHQRILTTLQAEQIQHIDLTEAFFVGGIDTLQFANGPNVFADLDAQLAAFNLPASAADFLRTQRPKQLLIEKVRDSSKRDTVHPNFLGHYIAAHEIARFVEKRRN